MEKWRKDREIERDRKKKEQESAETISGLKREKLDHLKQDIIVTKKKFCLVCPYS